MNDIQQLFREYLQQPEVMQLATVRDGQPWACTVHFAIDDNLHLYWASTPDSRHSKEIADDPRVAIAVAIQAVHGKPPIGIQIEGDARAVEDADERKRIAELFQAKLHASPKWTEKLIDGTASENIYHLKPRLYVLFDKQSFPDDPRKEWRP